jgi:uncharacterized phiE125 gp8 family phage protein
MALALVTAPAYEPISLVEAKLFLKVDTTADDPLIEDCIRAAREYGERFTQSAFIQQTWDDKRDGFPCGLIWLERPPVQSITSISYVDNNGDSQTWSSAEYRTDLLSSAIKSRIEPAYGYSYPSTRGIINAVTVRQVCGYSSTSKSVTSITSSGATATVTTTASHGYATGDRIAIAGAVQAAYNGTFAITVTAATTFTYSFAAYASSATSPATGTITAATFNVPSGIVGALKLLIAKMYEKRAASVDAAEVTDADAMLWPYRAA